MNRPCTPGPASAGVCNRGTPGCIINHVQRVRRKGNHGGVWWGASACCNTDGRPADDFPGCID